MEKGRRPLIVRWEWIFNKKSHVRRTYDNLPTLKIFQITRIHCIGMKYITGIKYGVPTNLLLADYPIRSFEVLGHTS